jgi:hypothetical protein
MQVINFRHLDYRYISHDVVQFLAAESLTEEAHGEFLAVSEDKFEDCPDEPYYDKKYWHVQGRYTKQDGYILLKGKIKHLSSKNELRKVKIALFLNKGVKL